MRDRALESGMGENRSYIRVSEIGEWVFCSVAWRRHAEGVLPNSKSVRELDAGREFHNEHGGQLARSESAKRMLRWLTVGIMITAGALLAYLFCVW